MKQLAIVLIAIGSLLSGCIVAEPPSGHTGSYRGDRDRDGIPNRMDRDRDGDGVPNRRDSRPDNARRY